MKIIFILALSLFINPFGNSQTPLHADRQLDNLVISECKHHEHILAFSPTGSGDNIDIVYDKLEWEIDPAIYYIKGTITTRFRSLETDLNKITLDLATQMKVTKIWSDGIARTLSFTHKDNVLEIQLGNVLQLDEMGEVTIQYEGEPNTNGFGSFSQTFHGPDQAANIWTLSEPYGAFEWWPCKSDLTDKVDSVDIYITIPNSQKAASNGTLVSISPATSNSHTYYWKHRYPISTYLVALSVTNYEVFGYNVKVPGQPDIPIINYIYPEDVIDAKIKLKESVEIMKFFNGLIGVYPFAKEKYGHAQFGWGGGMEHQTISFMGSFGFNLIGHEMAHQWFGDAVTCGSWQDIWLNEGFATYLDGLSEEHKIGDLQPWLKHTRPRVTNQDGGSIFVKDTTTTGSIFNSRLSYRKAALVLHMMRWKVGNDNFFNALKNYLNDDELSYGFSRTADLKRHMEDESGVDLTEFLDDWYYGEGHPSYQLHWTNKENGVHLIVDQTTSHASVDFYEMPIPVFFRGDLRDTLIVLNHETNGQEFNIVLPFNVNEVIFDPELWILSKDNTVDMITAISDPNLDEIVIFPNPTSKFIKIESPIFPVLGFSIVDNSGKVIMTQKGTKDMNEINVAQLLPGIYYLNIQTINGESKFQFVKE